MLRRWFLLFLLIIPIRAVSAPSISTVSGIIEQGQTVTVSGSGFGAHADNNTSRSYLIRAWENFETGTADSIFTSNEGPELVTNTSLQKANSNYAAKGYAWTTAQAYTDVWGQPQNTWKMYGFYLSLPAKEKKIFMSGWFMFPLGFDTGIRYDTGVIDQTKFMMMTPVGETAGKTYFATRRDSVDIPVMTNTEDGDLAEGTDDPLFNYSPMGEWHRFDMYIDLTKPDGQKIHNWYVDGKKLSRVNEFYVSDAVIDGFNYLSWLGYQFTGDDIYTWFQYMDDAYVDLTQARVEISEYATWSDTVQHQKEIQIPTTWSDTEITVSANLGQFAPGETAYVYVIDDSGLVSGGYEITIPGGPQSRGTVPLGDMR